MMPTSAPCTTSAEEPRANDKAPVATAPIDADGPVGGSLLRPESHARPHPPHRSWTSRPLQEMVLALWALATLLAAGMAAAGFGLDNSVGVWFPADDPALDDYRRSLDDFGHREWVLVGLDPRPYSPVRDEDRARLVERISRLADVHHVLSADGLPPDAPLAKAFLRPGRAGSSEALLVQVTNDLDRSDGYRETLVAGIQDAALGLPTLAAVRVAGPAVVNGELNRAARRDMWLFFPAVVLFLGLGGLLLFGNARDTAVLLAVALSCVTLTMGLLIATGSQLNMVTIMLPTVIIALSVADVVHLIHAFHGAREAGIETAGAARRAVREVALPCLGTTLTTTVGFLSFAGSSVRPVHQLAVFGALGIALAWGLTLTVGATLLALLWRGQSRASAPTHLGTQVLLERIWRWATARPRTALSAFGVLGLTLVGLGELHADTDYVRFFREGARVPSDYRALERGDFPQNPLTLVLDLPGEDGLARHWEALAGFAEGVARVSGVRSVLSPSLLAPSPEVLGRAGVELGLVSETGGRVQLTVMTDYPSSRRLQSTLGEIRALGDSLLPAGVRLTPTGTSLLFSRMDQGVVETQARSVLVTVTACLLILAVLFRSLGLAVLGMALSFYPVAVVLGVMGLLGLSLNMATVLIAGIAVGLAVDDTIHLVWAWQELRRGGVDRREASRRATARVGLRMVVTSAILVGSFAAMGLSGFMPTAQFGILTSATILLALAADLVLLPLLLAGARPFQSLTRREITTVELRRRTV